MTASRITELRLALRLFVQKRGNTWTTWEARHGP